MSISMCDIDFLCNLGYNTHMNKWIILFIILILAIMILIAWHFGIFDSSFHPVIDSAVPTGPVGFGPPLI